MSEYMDLSKITLPDKKYLVVKGPNREEVIQALRVCCLDEVKGNCKECPYKECGYPRCRIEWSCDALTLLRVQESRSAGVWHKWPEEKPEDYVDSTVPDGKARWEITCLVGSKNGNCYFSKRIRYRYHDHENCHWSNEDSIGWWMFVPKPPKGEENV